MPNSLKDVVIVSAVRTPIGKHGGALSSVRPDDLAALVVGGWGRRGLAPALGLLAGVTEMIPTIGPWIGGIVAGIVTLAISPDKIFWVILLFVAIQLVENHLLVPKVQGTFLHIHPAVMLFLLVLGIYMAGFWGALLIGPLTALLVELFKYVRDCQRRPVAPELTPEEG